MIRTLLKCSAHEATGWMIVGTLLALIGGACWLLDHFLGKYAFAAGFVLLFLALQSCIIAESYSTRKHEKKVVRK